VTKAVSKLANPTRRASRVPLDVAIAQLEEAIRTGVVDSDPAIV